MNTWMKVAYNEAVTGMLAGDGAPFGALLLKDGQIISTAHNEVLITKDPTAHAEINAIRMASKKLNSFDLSGCTLYTTCMPCPMCLGAIMWARISRVYYGASEEDSARGGFDDHRFYERIKNEDQNFNLKQIDHEENAKLFDIWNQKDDREMY